jgi:hypothetical protein
MHICCHDTCLLNRYPAVHNVSVVMSQYNPYYILYSHWISNPKIFDWLFVFYTFNEMSLIFFFGGTEVLKSLPPNVFRVP